MKNKLLVIVAGIVVSLVFLECVLRIVGFLNVKRSDIPKQHHDSYVIVSIGDSYTVGSGAPFDKSYPRQLEAMLNAKAKTKRFHVINRGIGSYNTTQILNEFRNILSKDIKPDLVVVLCGGANYWNYWGFHNTLKEGGFTAKIADYMYRVRIFKLAKLLFLKIKEKNEDSIAASKAVSFVMPKASVDDQESHITPCQAGWRCIQEKKTEEALTLFKKGLLQGTAYQKDCYLGLGRVYKDLGFSEEAIAWYTKGMMIDPADSRFYAGIGQVYSDQRYYDQAIAWFTKGLAINPNNQKLYVGLGTVYGYQNKSDEAVAWFKKGIEVNPNDAACYLGAGYYLYCGSGGFEEAKKYIKKGIALNQEPNNWLNIFYSGLTQKEKEIFLDEIKKEDLLPAWFLPEVDSIVLSHMVDETRFIKQIEQWVAQDLETILSLAKKNGSKVLLLSYPSYPLAPNLTPLLQKIAKENSIPFLDTERIFSELLKKGGKYEYFFVPDSHCNAEGYSIMARSIADKIEQEKMFDLE
jgi:tetratricopeptide (TPR) repeat protein